MSEFVTPDILQSNWKRFVETANKYNKPDKFTALIAFEWTSIPNGRNMHRNVFFRDDTGPVVPFSSFDSIFPEDLWSYQEIQRDIGHDNLANPFETHGAEAGGWSVAFQGLLVRPARASK
jgi:hypothetical protein